MAFHDRAQDSGRHSSRSDIVDADSMESYYEDIGFQTYHDGNHKGFERFEAIAVQRQVDADTRGKVIRTH